MPPAGQLETTRVLKAVISGRAELARLDQATALMPDPRVLRNAIPLPEAQASSGFLTGSRTRHLISREMISKTVSMAATSGHGMPPPHTRPPGGRPGAATPTPILDHRLRVRRSLSCLDGPPCPGTVGVA